MFLLRDHGGLFEGSWLYVHGCVSHTNLTRATQKKKTRPTFHHTGSFNRDPYNGLLSKT